MDATRVPPFPAPPPMPPAEPGRQGLSPRPRPAGRLHRGPMALAPTIPPQIIHRTMPLTPGGSVSNAFAAATPPSTTVRTPPHPPPTPPPPPAPTRDLRPETRSPADLAASEVTALVRRTATPPPPPPPPPQGHLADPGGPADAVAPLAAVPRRLTVQRGAAGTAAVVGARALAVARARARTRPHEGFAGFSGGEGPDNRFQPIVPFPTAAPMSPAGERAAAVARIRRAHRPTDPLALALAAAHAPAATAASVPAAPHNGQLTRQQHRLRHRQHPRPGSTGGHRTLLQPPWDATVTSPPPSPPPLTSADDAQVLVPPPQPPPPPPPPPQPLPPPALRTDDVHDGGSAAEDEQGAAAARAAPKHRAALEQGPLGALSGVRARLAAADPARDRGLQCLQQARRRLNYLVQAGGGGGAETAGRARPTLQGGRRRAEPALGAVRGAGPGARPGP